MIIACLSAAAFGQIYALNPAKCQSGSTCIAGSCDVNPCGFFVCLQQARCAIIKILFFSPPHNMLLSKGTFRGIRFLGAFFMFVLLGLPIMTRAATNVSVGDTVNQPTVWNLSGSPYIVTGRGFLQVESDLTIEPGVVVKFVSDQSNLSAAGLRVVAGGRLLASGTAEQPIIFTSVNDTVGGGNTGINPEPGDWIGLQFDSDYSVLNHVSVLYAGVVVNGQNGAVDIRGTSHVHIENSVIANSGNNGLNIDDPANPELLHLLVQNNQWVGIRANVQSHSVTISDSEIRDNHDGALTIVPGNKLLFTSSTFSGSGPQIVFISNYFGPAVTGQARWQYLSGLTYLVQNNEQIQVASGSMLNIDPGVNVKFDSGGGFHVQGNLVAAGSSELPIIFTSYLDNTVGGDTTVDGSGGMPSYGDWGGLWFDHGQGTLQYFTMRHGGDFIAETSCQDDGGPVYGTLSLRRRRLDLGPYCSAQFIFTDSSELLLDHASLSAVMETGLLVSGNASTTITNTQFDDAVTGIELMETGSYFHLKASEFTNMISAALVNDGSNEIDAAGNYWGDDAGPRTSTDMPGGGAVVRGNVRFDPWTTKTKRNPVILVPGILGSELWLGNDLLWPNQLRMFFSFDESFMDPLAMDEGGLPSVSGVRVGGIVSKVDSIVSTLHIFDTLIQSFGSTGYSYKNLLVFPYDWRLDIKTNSDKLATFIAEHSTSTGKVDIVAHSMGGLVIKQYLLDHPASSTINTLIFVGTPHLGAPSAAKNLLFGDDFNHPNLVNNKELKKISLNMPSVYELLPSREYVSSFGKYLYDYNYISSPDMNYDQSLEYLSSQGYNTALLNRAEAFHTEELDNMVFPGNMNVFNISGCKVSTLKNIIYRNNQPGLVTGEYANIHDSEFMADVITGDETVPLASATHLNIPSEHQYFTTTTKHSELPSANGVRNLIVDLITHPSSEPILAPNILRSSDTCDIKGHLISLHSPINIHIYDAVGNHVGVNVSGTLDMDIPGVSYDDFNGNKFVFLPDNPANPYRIELQATATGTFNMRVADVENNATVQTIYYNNVPIIPVSHGQVELSTNPDTNTTEVGLALDHDNTNNYQFIPVTSVLDSTSSLDFTKPTTILNQTDLSTHSSIATTTFTTSSILIILSATDDNSGLLRTEYSLDNGATWQIYSEPLIISQENQILLYRSLDKAGNLEETQSLLVPIDRTPPEVAIHFNTTTRDYILTGIDASTTIPSQIIATNTLQFQDQAGNTTIAQYTDILTNNNFGYFTRTFELKNLQKSNTTTPWLSPIRNQIFTQWQTSKPSPTSTIAYIQDMMQIKNGFYVIAKYDSATKETTYWQKLPDGTREEAGRAPGDSRPTLQTNNLSFIYF